ESLFSGFVQDEIRASDSLWFTIGCKLEHNAYTGLQAEPSLRLAWSTPGGRYTLWAAASRAMRQPARSDTDLRMDLPPIPATSDIVQVPQLLGNPRAKNEDLRDYELGYRTGFTKTLSLDWVTFLSFYRNLQTIGPLPTPAIPGLPGQPEIPMQFDSTARALTYGGEGLPRWH